jgi:hypothetical protein
MEGKQCTIVTPISSIVAACHLAPNFKALDEDKVDLSAQPDLLSLGRKFYFNHFHNHFLFNLVDHWRTAKKALHKPA